MSHAHRNGICGTCIMQHESCLIPFPPWSFATNLRRIAIAIIVAFYEQPSFGIISRVARNIDLISQCSIISLATRGFLIGRDQLEIENSPHGSEAGLVIRNLGLVSGGHGDIPPTSPRCNFNPSHPRLSSVVIVVESWTLWQRCDGSFCVSTLANIQILMPIRSAITNDQSSSHPGK
jgi:hypothetical protein